MKRILSIILAALMIAGTMMFTSCGKEEATKPANVFRETSTEISGMNENTTNINNFVLAGDKLYMAAYSYDPETFSPTYEILNYDIKEKKFGESTVLEFSQNENDGENLVSFAASEDGTAYLLVEKYSFSENEYSQNFEIRRIKGDSIDTVDVDFNVDDFYAQSMTALSDGSIVIGSWNSLCIVSPDGKQKFVNFDDPDNMNINEIYNVDGEVYVVISDYSADYKTKLCHLNIESGELDSDRDIDNKYAYNMMFGPGYDFYYNDNNTCIYGVDIESGELREVLNFINSDINANHVRQIMPISADEFLFVIRDRKSNGTTEWKISNATRVPDDEVVPKKMLRLAVNYASYDLRSMVIDFNKSNDTYRITIDDYSRYNTDENYQAGIEKLNSDIIAGNIPDIFIMTNEMPYDVYAAKGIFADIYEFMEKDESFDKSKYLENVFKAYEYDGKLLTIVPSFYVTTFAAKEELMGSTDSWNLDEFMAFAKAHPEMSMFDYGYNRSIFIDTFMQFSRDKFIDSESGECSFDSKEFRQLLEFTKSLSEDEFWESIDPEDQNDMSFWTEYDNRYKENRVLLTQVQFNDLNYDVKSILNYTLGAEPTYVGFPVSEGNGALISSYFEYGVSANSKFKDGAWEFIKTMISEKSQMPFYNEEYDYWEYPAQGLPIYAPALDKMVEIAMTPPKEDEVSSGGAVALPTPRVYSSTVAVATAETAAAAEAAAVEETAVPTEDAEVSDKKVVSTEIVAGDDSVTIDADVNINGGIYIDGIGFRDPFSIPLTEKQVERVLAVINGTTKVMRSDKDLNDIIGEELQLYFAGTQSLDDTVDYIQNRVTFYINESR